MQGEREGERKQQNQWQSKRRVSTISFDLFSFSSSPTPSLIKQNSQKAQTAKLQRSRQRQTQRSGSISKPSNDNNKCKARNWQGSGGKRERVGVRLRVQAPPAGVCCECTVFLPVLLSLSVCLLLCFAHITKLAAITCTLPNEFALLTLNLLLLLLNMCK